MPEFEPQNVLMLSAEDGLADTIRPRLDSMGADVSRIFAMRETFSFDFKGLARLEAAIATHKPALVIIDPLVAYLGASVDLNRSNETRPIMAGLAVIAERQRCAILAVRHWTKGSTNKAMYRGIGSIDLSAACRSALIVGCDPQAPYKRALAQIKNNLAEMGDTQGFTIEDGRFFWTGPSELTVEMLLGSNSDGQRRSALKDAQEFLREYLADGPRDNKEVKRKAKEIGISEKTLYRAYGQVCKRAFKSRDKKDGPWLWELRS